MKDYHTSYQFSLHHCSSMHLSQHKLCTRETELALELKFYLDFHRVTWPLRRTLTNGSDVKYVFPRCPIDRIVILELTLIHFTPPATPLFCPEGNCPPAKKGEKGEPGQGGVRGEPGNAGPDGPPGEKSACPLCPPNPKGQPGNAGPDGQQGPPGEIGALGPPGVRGRTGKRGPAGPDGNPGIKVRYSLFQALRGWKGRIAGRGGETGAGARGTGEEGIPRPSPARFTFHRGFIFLLFHYLRAWNRQGEVPRYSLAGRGLRSEQLRVKREIWGLEECPGLLPPPPSWAMLYTLV